MGVFLGLGQTELGQPLLGHPFAQGVHDIALGVGGGDVIAVGCGIFHHPQHGRPLRALASVKAIKPRLAKRRQNLPRAVGAEVEAEHPVAILGPLIAADHRGGDEFIRFALDIRRRHCRRSVRRHLALGVHHRLIGAGNTVPAVVAVHRPIAPDHGGHRHTGGQFDHQRIDKFRSGRRRHIAPVGDRMQRHRHAMRCNGAAGRDHMAQMPMHPAIRHNAHQMRHPAGRLHLGDKFEQGGILRERAVLDRQINRAQIHRHHTARADIGVTYLGVAHLPRGQTHFGAKGGQRAVRATFPEPVEVRHLGLRGGAGRGVGPDPPAIKNTQNNGGARHGSTFRSCPLLPPATA